MREVEAVVLETRLVRVRPLAPGDALALAEACRDGSLWTLPTAFVPKPAEMEEAVADLLRRKETGAVLPFVIEVRNGDQVVGQASYVAIAPEHRRLEIGGTWIAGSWQRTFVNTHAQFLLLRHAFENLSCNAVAYVTDVLNHRSQDAIERLGAQQDGVLRAHMVMRDGRVRDSAVYSIVKAEWPMVRSRLEQRVEAGGSSAPAARRPRASALP